MTGHDKSRPIGREEADEALLQALLAGVCTGKSGQVKLEGAHTKCFNTISIDVVLVVHGLCSIA